jgi:hypothetical protein
MDVPPVARVDIGSLSLGAKVGAGGQGNVTAVNHFLINRQWNAVLKAYSPAAVAAIRPAVLEELVRFPRLLSPENSNWLHNHTAWPAVIVEDNGTVNGFLMREVPAQYYFGFRTRTQGIQRRLADVAFLLNPDDYVASAGLTVSVQDRVALLLAIASTLSRLHSLGISIGDLSPKNLLFSLAPSPSCFVLDCDTVRVNGETVLDQVDTPDWESPSDEPKATTASDAYKFCLLAIRLFARDQSSRDPGALAAISPQLGQLAEGGLNNAPAQRPGPEIWLPALEAARSSAPGPLTLAPPPPRAIISSRQSSGCPPVAVPADTVSSHAQAHPRVNTSPRRNGPRVALATALLLVILSVIIAVVLTRRTPGPAQTSALPAAGQSSTQDASAPSSTSSSPGWTAFQDPGEFSIMLPPGWTVTSQTGTEVEFTGQPQGFVIVVAWTTHPKPDQLTDWEQQAAGKAQADPTYQQIGIQRVDYRGYNAADWEFRNIYRGELTHVIDRGFIVQPGQLAYAIELYGPNSGFPSVYTNTWSRLVTGFEPTANQ